MSCAGAWGWGTVPVACAPRGTTSSRRTSRSSPERRRSPHARGLTAAVGKDPPRSVVLVGHSYGGLVVPRAAELLGDAAAALVVVDGLMPEPGESGFDLRPARAEARRAEGRERGDGMWTAGAESP